MWCWPKKAIYLNFDRPGRHDGRARVCLQCGVHALVVGPPSHRVASGTDKLENRADPPFADDFVGFLIIGFCMLGIFSLFLGLILVIPMLGHGSWHAYRHLVDVSDLEERITEQGER